MRNIILLGFSLLIGLPSISQAQISDKVVPHFGLILYQVQRYIDPPSESFLFGSSEARQTMQGLNVGAYYVLLHKNDVFSLGVDGSVQPGITFSGNGFISWQVQTPVYLMGRIGANATPYNEQRFGFAAGIGGIYTYSALNLNQNFNLRASYANPAAMVQATLGNFTGRAQFTIQNSQAGWEEKNFQATRDIDGSLAHFSIGLMYAF